MFRYLPVTLIAVAGLAACTPASMKGVDTAKLDEAISRAVGDPKTCVLIAEAGSGKVVHQYNNHAACRAKWPPCDGGELRSAGDLVALTARDGQVRTQSCNSNSDGSRGVAWAAGPVQGRPLVYAAIMEGERSFPGLMMADRLGRAFARAGLAQ